MKRAKFKKSPILIIALCVAVVAGYLVYWNTMQNKTTDTDDYSETTTEINSDLAL